MSEHCCFQSEMEYSRSRDIQPAMDGGISQAVTKWIWSFHLPSLHLGVRRRQPTGSTPLRPEPGWAGFLQGRVVLHAAPNGVQPKQEREPL